MRIYKPRYTADDGTRRTSGKYWVRFSVAGQRYEKPLDTSDRQAAAIKAGEIIKAHELRAVGAETHIESRGAKPSVLAAEYVRELQRQGREPRHYNLISSRLTSLLGGVSTLSDVTPERIRATLARIAEREKLTGRTANRYRIALFGFFRWLVKEGRWNRNPIEAVPRARETDPDRRRRALTPEEVEKLLATAPADRALVYLVAATTGLRRKELRLLQWGDIDFAEGTLRVRAKTAKGRKESTLPLTPRTLDVLAAARKDAPAGVAVFDTVPEVPILRADLAAAGIDAAASEDILDFHGLRVTFGTTLARSGVTLAEAQKLMRHCTPALTSNIYTRLTLRDGRGAMKKLEATLDDARASNAREKTAADLLAAAAPGTGSSEKSLPPRLPPSPCIPTDSIALTRTAPLPLRKTGTCPQPHAAPRMHPTRRAGRVAECGGFENRGGSDTSASAAVSSGDSAPALPPRLSPSTPDETHSAARPDPVAVARSLLVASLSTPDPRPLLEGARALLTSAGADPRAKLAHDVLGAAGALADPAPVVRAALALLAEERASSPAAGFPALRVLDGPDSGRRVAGA